MKIENRLVDGKKKRNQKANKQKRIKKSMTSNIDELERARKRKKKRSQSH